MHGACMQTSEPPFQQAEPQPEHRVLAEGSTEAAKHAASGKSFDVLAH